MREWARVSVRARPWMREAPKAYVNWYVDQISQSDPLLAAEFYRGMAAVDFVPLLKDIRVPTLYLEGTRDRLITGDEREALVKAPNVRTVAVDGPSYDIGYARPEACAAQVQAFLTELRVLEA